MGKVKRINRKFIALSGRIPNDYRFVIHNNTRINVLRALMERVFFVEGKDMSGNRALVLPPTTTRATFFGNMQMFADALKRHLPSVTRMSIQQFVETSPVHKKKIYANAAKEYLTCGMSPRQSSVTSFIKAEKVAITKTKPDPAPRIIQPRGVVFNLIFGCFIRPSEKKIYKAIDDVYGRPTVCCGQNAEEMAEMIWEAWTEITDPIALSLDLSRMDQHVSSVALKWEHQFYRHLFKDSPQYDTLDWCLQATVNNKGRVYTCDSNGNKCKILYSKHGSRMSGDMNTSLGNKIIMCGLLYSYFTGYLGFKTRVDYNVIDNGDDCVVILSRTAYARYLRLSEQVETLHHFAVTDPKKWWEVYMVTMSIPLPPSHLNISDWFTTMGFTLKIEGLVDSFPKIEFCQTQPCYIDNRWIMVRTPKALAKDMYCLKPLEVLTKWLSQVKGGGLATYGSVPIFSSFYKTLPSLDPSKERDLLYGTGMYYLSRGMSSSQVVTEMNRYHFWETFGILPREQEVIEEIYEKMEYVKTPQLQELPNVTLPLPL